MLTKIKISFISFFFILSFQTTTFTMDQNSNIDFADSEFHSFEYSEEDNPNNSGDIDIKPSNNQFVLINSNTNSIPQTNIDTQAIISGMLPHKGKTQQPQEFNIALIFQQLFSTKNTVTVKEELIAKLTLLKEKNEAEKKDFDFSIHTEDFNLITDADVNEIKTLWNQFKSLHNHDWLECIINPFRKTIDPSQITKDRNTKPLNLLLHSNHYLPKNRKQMDSLFIELADSSRPNKATDPILCFASDTVIEQSVLAAIVLANKMFPCLFTRRSFENKLLQQAKAINIKDKKISNYKNAINTIEQRTHNKYALMKTALDTFCLKDKALKN